MPRYFNTTGPCDPAEHYFLASAVRMPEFTDIVKMLADVRNRVAHLGDLTHDEFVRVEKSVLSGREPGQVLRVLGIG